MRQGSRFCSLVVVTYFVALMPKAISRDGRAQNSITSQHAAAVGTGSVIRISERENSRLLVPVSVNGKRQCPFLFDTGATTTVLSKRLATKTSVNARSAERIQTFAGKVPISVGRADTLRIGNRSFVDSEVLIGDLGQLFNLEPEVDGILGQDVLSRFNYLLDRRGRKLEIEEEGGLAAMLAGTRVPFEKHGGKIYVPVAGGTLRLMLDSGNPYLVIYEDATSKIQTILAANFSGEQAVGSFIGRRAIRQFRIASLEIGDCLLRNVEALQSTRDSGRSEDGFLPLRLFDSIYVNNLEGFLIVNPRWNK